MNSIIIWLLFEEQGHELLMCYLKESGEAL